MSIGGGVGRWHGPSLPTGADTGPRLDDLRWSGPEITDVSRSTKQRGRNHNSRLALAGWALLFAAAFHWSYVRYIAVDFSYANYTYEDPSAFRLLFSYAAVVAPLVRYDPRSLLPAKYLTAVLYVSVYIPVVLGTALMWRGPGSELTRVQLFVCITMFVMFEASRIRIGSQRNGRLPLPPRMVDYGIIALTALNVTAIVSLIGANFQIVAFTDVYEQRFANSGLVQGPIFGYLLAWQTSFFSPYLIAIGLARKKAFPIAVGLIGSIAIYGSFADKIAILMPALIVLIRFAGRGGFLRVLLAGASVATALAMAISATTGWMFQIKSLVLLRTTTVPGHLTSRYYDFFSENGYTYWSHFRPLNGVFSNYAYGERSLGEVVGFDLSADEIANFNANFWASDGIAAAGPEGVLVLAPALAILVLGVNFLGNGVEPVFFSTMLTGFMVILANAPLTTSLVTGGLVWIVAVRFSMVMLTRGSESEAPGGGPDPARLDQRVPHR